MPQISSVSGEPFLVQPQDASVGDSLLYKFEQYVLPGVAEKAPNICVKNVVHLLLLNRDSQRIQRVMLAAPRSKPVGETEKVLFVNLIEDDDPTAMYRGWGAPLSKPWDFNQAQNMFSLSQTFPGTGKRALRTSVAQSDVEVAKAQLAEVRLEVQVRVRKVFDDLLLADEEMRIHAEHVGIARQAIEAACIKYAVGKVSQQDILKAQVALTALPFASHSAARLPTFSCTRGFAYRLRQRPSMIPSSPEVPPRRVRRPRSPRLPPTPALPHRNHPFNFLRSVCRRSALPRLRWLTKC